MSGVDAILGSAPGHTPPSHDYVVVRTFFATDRSLGEVGKNGQAFGSARGYVSYGVCDVSIPRDHRKGFLEAPSLWELEIRGNPNKHVIVLSTMISDKGKFFSDVSARIRSSVGKKAFLFVHGYNVTFEDAARRTAQMSYDLEFVGAPVFYSWPSQGTKQGYITDEQNIEWSQSDLEKFLGDFFSKSDADNIYLIAHSMGNRALTRALSAVTEKNPEIKTKLKEVILAAPDIDADVFRRDIAPALANTSIPVTLYASSKDRALMASRKVHGGFPRAGEAGDALVVAPGIESIDASDVDTGFLGHSYFAETKSVIQDIFHLIRTGRPADERCWLDGHNSIKGRYWMFIKDKESDNCPTSRAHSENGTVLR